LNQEKVNQSLRRVERAIENIHAYMGAHLEDSKGEAKRRHTRYAKKALLARLQFKGNPLIKEDEIVEAKVLDVSAGGMCILVPSSLRVKKQDGFKFIVLKNGGMEQVICGDGKIVRLSEQGNERELGVKFLGRVQS
jgi:c-di-GMP-binding flagellar brake protein YcgR